jgi:hypothetical protein
MNKTVTRIRPLGPADRPDRMGAPTARKAHVRAVILSPEGSEIPVLTGSDAAPDGHFNAAQADRVLH